MTIQDVITNIDNIKPNQYDEGTKLDWINQIENKVYQMMKLRKGSEDIKKPHITIESDYDETLLIPDTYSDIYMHYLSAKIDYYNGETKRYNNSMIMFNSSMEEFENYWYRQHPQIQ